MKQNEQPFHVRLHNGTTVLGAFSSNVSSIRLCHENPDVMPQSFEVVMQPHTFTCKIEQPDGDCLFTKMKGSQFPIISNSATTGHKLQGASLARLLINSWHYGRNWVYVALSRVVNLNGLHIKEPLSYDLQKYEKPEDMRKMLDDLEKLPFTLSLSRTLATLRVRANSGRTTNL